MKILLIAMLSAAPAFADDAAVKPAVAAKVGRVLKGAPRYAPLCLIEGGEGVGLIKNMSSERIRVRGTVWFYFYDEDGDLLGKERESASASISRGDTEEVERSDAPKNTKSCVFDPAGAVEGEEDSRSYTTNCVIVGDNEEAQGFVHNKGRSSLRVSGEVWFRFYDRRGGLVRERSARASETISAGRSELVDTLSSVPSRAESCSFDIDGAID